MSSGVSISSIAKRVENTAQGDRVMVVDGDLKNLMGRVTRVGDDGKVDVMPSMEGLTQVLTFEPGQLEKFFEVRRCPNPNPDPKPYPNPSRSIYPTHVL